MKNFAAALVSLFTKQTVVQANLFHFEIAEYGFEAFYTSYDKQVSYGGDTYLPIAINLSGDKDEDEGVAETKEFTINVEIVEPFATLAVHRFGGLMNAIVYEIYLDEDTSTWYGSIIAEGQLIKQTRTMSGFSASFKGMSSWLSKKIPGVLVSRNDQRMFFSDGFIADKDDFKQTGCDIQAGSSDNIIKSIAAGYDHLGAAVANEYYKNGTIEYTRTVTGVDAIPRSVTFRVPIITNTIDPLDETNNAFKLLYPPPYLQDDTTFDAIAGYDGSPALSKHRFNNFIPSALTWTDPSEIIGFLGFPHLPIENPALNPSAFECR